MDIDNDQIVGIHPLVSASRAKQSPTSWVADRLKLLHFGGQCEKTYIVGGGKQDGSRKYETTVHP